ncbi:MAG: phosphoenolpyruvate kinase [Proteobacteria bacterium]|nr:phosphoenolpyruvate kinase [Pseudomonadota bacterium]
MALFDDAADILPIAFRACAAQEAPFARAREGLRTRSSFGPDPVHTLYWGAHRCGPNIVGALGQMARETWSRYAATPETLAEVLGMGAEMAAQVHARVSAKLEREPIEDLRVDFEDGYGLRSDCEEDAAAVAAGRQIGEELALGNSARRFGIRIKALTETLARRGIETLELFTEGLVAGHGGQLPPGFVVTLPKVTVVEQLEAMDVLLQRLEASLGVAQDSIGLEFMIEVPHAVFDGEGRLVLPRLLARAGRRLLGVHLGVYDFTAASEIVASRQAMDHPACDLVRGLMRLSYSGSGRMLSAGSTNVLPIPPHRGSGLNSTQLGENAAAVHDAWRCSQAQILHTLERGYYHGWDLHPAQVPVRFAACYRFYREDYAAMAARMASYLEQATAATDDGAVLDDVATGQALLDFFRRGYACGAFDAVEITRAGLTIDELAEARFADLLHTRLAARA